MSSETDDAARGAVGVTIITGFLGSGKSTLIRRVLTQNHGLRIVVVENEFGASSGVESAIVTQGLGPAALENFVELPNGCVCCSAQSDLTNALSRLVRERRKTIDHILIEASGLADPGPVAASFWLDAELESELRLDAVVTVVDVLNVARRLDPAQGADGTAKLAQKQIAVADVVILNKCDLVHGQQFKGVRAAVARFNSGANMLAATQCDVDLRAILDIRAYDADVAKRDAERFAGHVSHVGTGAAALTVMFDDVYFDERAMDRAFGTLLWEESDAGMEIWRMKALVFIAGDEHLRVYQGVHTLFEGEETDIRAVDKGSVQSCFIFIGRMLREEHIRNVLSKAVAKDV